MRIQATIKRAIIDDEQKYLYLSLKIFDDHSKTIDAADIYSFESKEDIERYIANLSLWHGNDFWWIVNEGAVDTDRHKVIIACAGDDEKTIVSFEQAKQDALKYLMVE